MANLLRVDTQVEENSDRDAFVRGLTEKLLTYALGRGLERYDRPTVTEITARLSARDYKFSQLVLEIVNSLPFQMRAAPAAVSQNGSIAVIPIAATPITATPITATPLITTRGDRSK